MHAALWLGPGGPPLALRLSEVLGHALRDCRALNQLTLEVDAMLRKQRDGSNSNREPAAARRQENFLTELR